MVITHHGGQCFKVTFGDLTLVFDPIAKGATLPSVRFGAFELRNPRVAVMPGMDGQALLGMDVLRHFSLSQEGGRLRISRGAH